MIQITNKSELVGAERYGQCASCAKESKEVELYQISFLIQEEFKAKCKRDGFKMNEIVEILMSGYISGEIQIRKEISYRIHQKEN